MRMPVSVGQTLTRLNSDNMPDTVLWARSTGEPEIPGLGSFAAAVAIKARKTSRITTLGADRISNLTVAVPADKVVVAGDTLDGATVLEVARVGNGAGGVLMWMCYAKA